VRCCDRDVHRGGRGKGLAVAGSELGDKDDGNDDTVNGDGLAEDDAERVIRVITVVRCIS
jgi:hypothetical protein